MEPRNHPDFLEELRSLDEGTKRKVLIIATILIMSVVIFVWATYFNGIVMENAATVSQAATSTPAAAAPVPAAPGTAPGAGIWHDIGSGFAQFEKGISAGIRGIMHL